MEGYSLADIAAATGENGFGGNGFWIFALLVLMFAGNGSFLGRGDGFGQFAATQQEILFGQQFQGLDNKIDRIGNGIADATYALNNSITGEGRNIQMQLADCCCKNQKNVDDLRYDMAQNTQKILDTICQGKIESLQGQVNQLQLQQALAGIPKISNYGYGVTPNFCQGCGCGYGVA